MVDWRRVSGFVLPSLVAACAASLVVGFADGVFTSGRLLHALTAAGFISLFAAPGALLGALALRLLWSAWRFDALFAATRRDDGGSPLLAAWLLYIELGIWLVAAVAFNAVRMVAAMTSAHDVIALSSAIAVVVAVAVLVTLSRPLVGVTARLLGRIDGALHRRIGRSLLGPRALVGGAVGLALVLAWLVWKVSVEPRIGDFDTSFVGYLIGYLVVIAAVHVLWPLCARRRRVALGLALGGLVAVAAVVATAFYARFQRPYVMLEVWGESRLGGEAIDGLYDIQSLRGELHLAEFRPAERPGAAHPDIFLITIDTVRADHTPLYGGTADMPTLTQLGREGAVFQWAFSPGNVTRRSLPSIATGISATRVRGRVRGWALRLDPRHVLLAERLRAAGYDTAGFFCCASHFGAQHRLGLIRGIDHVELKKDGMALAEMTKNWLRERAASQPDRPLFVWIHFIEPHLWNETYPAKKFRGKPGRRYDMSLAAADRALGSVLAEVRSEARRDHTVVVVTADHGEGLGDHGHPHHSTALYNSQTRVPLVVVGPGIVKRRIAETVGLVDLAPTILDLAGFVPPGMPQMDGVSLAPVLRGEVATEPDQGEASSAMIADRSVAHGEQTLVVGRHKLIYDGKRYELYDLGSDPKERHNLVAKEPELLATMKQRLAQRHAEIDSVSPF